MRARVGISVGANGAKRSEGAPIIRGRESAGKVSTVVEVGSLRRSVEVTCVAGPIGALFSTAAAVRATKGVSGVGMAPVTFLRTVKRGALLRVVASLLLSRRFGGRGRWR